MLFVKYFCTLTVWPQFKILILSSYLISEVLKNAMAFISFSIKFQAFKLLNKIFKPKKNSYFTYYLDYFENTSEKNNLTQ